MPDLVQSIRAPLAPLFSLSSPTWKYPLLRPALAENKGWTKLTAEGTVHGRKIEWQIERKRDKYELSGTLEGDSPDTGAYTMNGIAAVPVRPPAAQRNIYDRGIHFKTAQPHDLQILEVDQHLWIGRKNVFLAGMIEGVQSVLKLVLEDDAILANSGRYSEIKGKIGPLNLDLRFDIFDAKWEIIGDLYGDRPKSGLTDVSMNAFIHHPKTSGEPWSMDWRAQYPGFEDWQLKNFKVFEKLHVRILSPSHATRETDAHQALDATQPETNALPPEPPKP